MFDDTFDPYGPGGGDADDDVLALSFPDAPMEPPTDVQQELRASGDNIPRLRGELRQTALDDQKKRLVDTFYNKVDRAYGLPLEGSIDYDQFGIDDDGITLYWTPGDKKIPIPETRGGVRFLGLQTLAKGYGVGGTNAIRRSLRLTGYKSNMPRLSKKAADTIQKAEEPLTKNIESIEMQNSPA